MLRSGLRDEDEMSRCGICGRGEGDAVSYHPQCLEKVFRASEFPRFDYSLAELKDLLVEQARDRISLPGETPVLAITTSRRNPFILSVLKTAR